MKPHERRLDTYRARRDFALTPEPSPEVEAPKRAGRRPLFVVHKHDATRLHYDLRLEMDGVLASWAVPKGPSYDPATKRLAVETEDHPLSYARFEGHIPDEAYGGGDSLLWEEGTYETVPPGRASEQRRAGHLVVDLEGHKLRGRWHLVRMKRPGAKASWLLFKARDAHARADYDVTEARPESVKSGRRVTRGPARRRSTSPRPAAAARKRRTRAAPASPHALLERVWPPMLARLSTPEEVGLADSLFEVKYDGFRALAALAGGKLSLQSRNALELGGRFPALAEALSGLRVREAVLDGEIVALDARGRSRFQLLQNVQNEGGRSGRQRFIAFDLLWLDGADLRERPLEERRARLERVLARAPESVAPSEQLDLPLARALAVARRRGWEGLIAKRRGSPYRGGRGSDWLKLKVVTGQEVVILGYQPILNERARYEIGSLLIGVHAADGFHHVGKVGTGFTSRSRRELKALLDRDRTRGPAAVDARPLARAVWVRPRHVCNVSFSEWTEDGRMRHPVYQGLRPDKRPEEVVRERPAPVAARARTAAQDKRGQRRAPTARAARHARPPTPPAADALLTSGERVLYPADGYTKADVFAYYREVAPVLVPVLTHRPLAVQQWPGGIGRPGFFRHEMAGVPDWVDTLCIRHERKRLRHVDVDRPEALLWLANQSALTLHMWHSHAPRLGEPDWVLFDLDPGRGGWADVVTVARTLRTLLEEMGLEGLPKTSGKRGLHVLVPLARGHTWARALSFARRVTARLAEAHPDIATTERAIGKRRGRLYLDAEQNVRGKTVVAPYSLRAVDSAPFSAPLRWEEVTRRLDPRRFNLRTLRARLDAVGDLFAPALSGRQRLPALR